MKKNEAGCRILPDEIHSSSRILPEQIRMESRILPEKSGDGILRTPAWFLPVLTAVLVLAGATAAALLHSVHSLAGRLDGSVWTQTGETGGVSTDLRLTFGKDTIRYDFHTELLDTTIASFVYTVTGPDTIMVNGQSIRVDLADGNMILTPSLIGVGEQDIWEEESTDEY